MSKALVIRADANTRMGTGHVMRCIALGQAWQDAGGTVTFVSCCDSDAIRQRIRDEGFGLQELDQAHPDSDQDLESTLRALRETGAPWLVTDGYHFDLVYQRAVRGAGIKLLYVDDCAHLDQYEADILINQNTGSEELPYLVNDDCRQLRGVQYVMLRREFRTRRKTTRAFPPEGGRILVTLGGGDADNVTLTVLQALEELGTDEMTVKIILGPTNPHLDSLQEAVRRVAFPCMLMHSVSDMPELMQWADLSITAAGSTCWELCRLGVPFLTLVVADNQRGVASGLCEDKVAPYLGETAVLDPAQMAGAIDCVRLDRQAREKMSRAGRNLIDPFGLDRILSRPMKDAGLRQYASRLATRQCTFEDAELLHCWANDSVTRANSFSPESVEWPDHCAWLREKLNSQDSLMFIIELDNTPCGQVRYDKVAPDSSEIDLSIAPQFRQMNLAATALSLSLSSAAEALGTTYHMAIVHADNQASAATFIKAGFNLQSKEVIRGIDCILYRWEANGQ